MTDRCSKVGYASKREAKTAKRSCQREAAAGASWRQECRIYRCTCGSWHLTSMPLVVDTAVQGDDRG